ncbi:hypothetical protein [Streptomyces formicae]|uniref:Uncharacterized protein n=1 Tax=Streptomyces formicae TaxID=1616117 RepID=A0ABY3WRI8_9ACTN|nr:hypothetical protein [Streptomyces formicae]UNM14265.1 hypothetical protein J4032_24875 [Streptomyces formicae]
MSRRVSLPGADELFRTTGGTGLTSSSPRRAANGAVASANGEARVPAQADEPAPEEHSPAKEEAESAEPRSRTAAAEGEAASSPAPAPAKGRSTGSSASSASSSSVAPEAGAAPRRRGRAANRRPSGRERHDEKITVYVSAEELMDLEHARLVLRGEHGLAVDRGRIVREAVAVVLADLESRGDASILVRRLRGR